MAIETTETSLMALLCCHGADAYIAALASWRHQAHHRTACVTPSNCYPIPQLTYLAGALNACEPKDNNAPTPTWPVGNPINFPGFHFLKWQLCNMATQKVRKAPGEAF